MDLKPLMWFLSFSLSFSFPTLFPSLPHDFFSFPFLTQYLWSIYFMSIPQETEWKPVFLSSRVCWIIFHWIYHEISTSKLGLFFIFLLTKKKKKTVADCMTLIFVFWAFFGGAKFYPHLFQLISTNILIRLNGKKVVLVLIKHQWKSTREKYLFQIPNS